MPQGWTRLASYVHPVSAFAAVALLLWVGSLGLRSRERGGRALRPVHARFAPWAALAVWSSLLAGLASARWLRSDLDGSFTAHGWIGVGLSLLIAASRLSSRRLAGAPRLRTAHAAVGLAALLLASLQVFFGLPLLAP